MHFYLRTILFRRTRILCVQEKLRVLPVTEHIQHNFTRPVD